MTPGGVVVWWEGAWLLEGGVEMFWRCLAPNCRWISSPAAPSDMGHNSLLGKVCPPYVALTLFDGSWEDFGPHTG